MLNLSSFFVVVFQGKMYWYDLLNVFDCNSLFPVFVMYTNGVLNGFGWILPFKLDNPRFVHPTNVSFPVGIFCCCC